MSKSIVLLAIEVFVALSLTVNLYYFSKPMAAVPSSGWAVPPVLFTYLSPHSDPTKRAILESWRTRIAAPATSAWILDKATNQSWQFDSEEFKQIYGLYNAGWLLLTFLALILARKDALFIMLGVFCGVMYYVSDVGSAFYPWDLPSMFFFTAAILLFDKNRLWALMLTVCIGALYKETVLCCAVLVLFSNRWALSRRIAAFIGIVAVRMVANKLLLIHYGVHVNSLAMNKAYSDAGGLFDPTLLYWNMKLFFSTDPRSVLFIDAGALLVILLIPWRNQRDVALKLVVIMFTFGQFLYGNLTEFRIWQELMPLGWMILAEFVALNSKFAPDTATRNVEAIPVKKDPAPAASHKPGKKATAVAGPAGTISTDLLFRGTHWFMIAALVVAAVGTYALAKHAHLRDNPLSIGWQLTRIHDLIPAAASGDLDAQYKIGVEYQGLGEITNAITWYQRAAEKGSIPAENSLAVLLAMAQHDYAGAVQWFTRAANQGDASAQNNLGICYVNGSGVPADYALAAQYFTKAAQQGFLQAQKTLVRMYQQGAGVPSDKLQAYHWLKMAALQGDKEAQNDLQALAGTMTPDQITAAEKLSPPQ